MAGCAQGTSGFFDEAGWFYLVDRKKDMISASGFRCGRAKWKMCSTLSPACVRPPSPAHRMPIRARPVIAFVSADPGAVLDVTALAQILPRAARRPTNAHADQCIASDYPRRHRARSRETH